MCKDSRKLASQLYLRGYLFLNKYLRKMPLARSQRRGTLRRLANSLAHVVVTQCEKANRSSPKTADLPVQLAGLVFLVGTESSTLSVFAL